MCFFSIPRMIIPRNAGQGSRRIKSRLSWHYLASPRKNILINIIIFHQIQERPQPFSTFDELKESVEGDVLHDEMSRAIYSSGSCLYRVRPLAIVRPKNRMDVVKVVKYGAQNGIPITARGGGTSRTGNELGEGIILDLSRYMNRILEFDCDGKWVRVQPGIILSSLNEFLEPQALFFPIDPSTKEYCTLGGMISNNSSGPHAVKYGTTRDYVLSLEVVLSNGDVITTGPVPLREKYRKPEETTETLEGKIYQAVPEILERFQISPEHAIYVGDSLVDYKTAKAAGVPLVSYKNTELEADYHVDHLMDIAGSVLGIGSGI